MLEVLINLIIIISCILTCRKFWRLGGDGKAIYRKIGVPVVIGVCKALLLGNFWALLYIPLLIASIQWFSYGLSAPIHRYWIWVFKEGETGDSKVVEVCTRACCGFLWALPGIVFGVINNNMIGAVTYIIFSTIAIGLVGGLVKDADESEKTIGGLVSLSILI